MAGSLAHIDDYRWMCEREKKTIGMLRHTHTHTCHHLLCWTDDRRERSRESNKNSCVRECVCVRELCTIDKWNHCNRMRAPATLCACISFNEFLCSIVWLRAYECVCVCACICADGISDGFPVFVGRLLLLFSSRSSDNEYTKQKKNNMNLSVYNYTTNNIKHFVLTRTTTTATMSTTTTTVAAANVKFIARPYTITD